MKRVAFLVALWVPATLFAFGDLGKVGDDYFFSGRDPVTGNPTNVSPLWSRPFFRPLTWWLVHALQRRFWFEDATLHLLGAVAHGVAVSLLVTFLVVIGCSSRAAFLAGALFLVWPAAYEVVFWSAALPIGVASSLFLLICLLAVWCLNQRGPSASNRLRAGLAATCVGSFAIPCLNEQPAAGLIAVPLLLFAATDEPDSRASPWSNGAKITLAAWSGPLLYGALFWATARPGRRGTIGHMPPLSDLPGELGRVASEVLGRLGLRDFASGAMEVGFGSLRAAPILTGTLALAIVWTAFGALRSVDARSRTGIQPEGAARLLKVFCFGIAVFLLDWLPVLVVSGMSIPSRLMYAPELGLAIATGAFIDLLRVRIFRGERWLVLRRVGALTLIGVLALCCVAMVGVQSAFRIRSRSDAQLASTLLRTLPSPAPHSLLLVLSDGRPRIATGANDFDEIGPDPLILPQAATPFVRWAYRRGDLFAAQPTPWGPVIISGITAGGATLRGLEPAFPNPFMTDENGEALVPWSQLIPIRIRADGGIDLLDRSTVRLSASRPES